jgi:hypothetical protein
MLILPTSKSTGGKARAQKLLRAVVEQRVHCTLVVFDDGEHPREIASRADCRAENDPFRAVVYIPDPTVLEGEPVFSLLAHRHAAGEEAVALTIRFEVSSCLKGPAALDFYELEQAFARAGAGMVAR